MVDTAEEVEEQAYTAAAGMALAIAVEDTTNSPVELASEDPAEGKVMAHTARPPVELMS